MIKYLSIAITLVLISIYAFAQGDKDYKSYVQEIESTWDKYSQAKEFEEFQLKQNAAFQAFSREQEEAYRKYRKEVEEKWNIFIGSTPKQWVEYGEDKNVRSIVNFEEKIAPKILRFANIGQNSRRTGGVMPPRPISSSLTVAANELNTKENQKKSPAATKIANATILLQMNRR